MQVFVLISINIKTGQRHVESVWNSLTKANDVANDRLSDKDYRYTIEARDVQ